MTTAHEVALRMVLAAPRIAALRAIAAAMTNDVATYGMAVVIGREVCARRARKLRKRGESVHYSGRSKNGKARYTWTKRIPPIEWWQP